MSHKPLTFETADAPAEQSSGSLAAVAVGETWRANLANLVVPALLA